jgi:xylan 1,4-beta-xylosidase
MAALNRLALAATSLVGLVSLAAADVSFTADLTQPLIPLRFVQLECVGSGHFALTLREDYRNALRAAQRDIGFKRIRGHGIFDDDVSSYLGGGFNGFNVFSTLDFYLSVGIKPILELSFMPEALASDPSSTIMHYKGITSPPSSFPAWAAFVTDFVQKLVERYGVDEVRSWAIEVWNEPADGGKGSFWDGTFLQYMELYNYTARAIKAVDPLIPVGGPATAGLGYITEFLAFVKNNSVPIDVLTTHR